jgi:Ca2+-transporting ATPase
VNPSHKLEIVRAMQGRGQIVAMTGDGVNDGPALKAADVGVALGQAGAETAREVADLVLMDDDLQSLITAIREGRAIYDDIQKSVHYITATNLSEILTVLGCVGGGLGQPLTPRQLLWINVLTDVLPCLALAVEPPHSDVMQRSPRDPQAALVTGRDYVRLGRQGAVMTAAGIGGYLYALARYGAGPQASTMAFLSLTAAQLLHAFSARSEQTIVGGSKLPPNHYLPLAVGGSLALEVLAMFVPPLRALLGLAPIGIVDALICFAAGAASLIANEAFKAPRKEQGTALPAAAIPLLPQREAA